MTNINLDMVGNSVIKALIREQAKFPEDFKLDICEDDEMYLFALSNVQDDSDRALVRYYSLGRRILDTIKQIVDWHFGGFENVPSFLDFACGYGRFTRFLIQEIPPERIWVADISTKAVKFQTEYFGVNGIISTRNPENYLVDTKFDCIIVNSFFSHMPERTFSKWLENLYNSLTPNGILIFSVHDECLRAPGAEMPEEGILFSPNSEIQSLDKADYGTTYVTEKFVRQIVDKVSSSKAFVHRIEKGLCRFQDLYIVTNQLVKDFSSLKFNQHPEGYVDVASFTNKGNLYLEGWAVDANQDGSIEEVQVMVNGKIIQRCDPFYDRLDIDIHFQKDATLQSGWNCYLAKDIVSPQDVLTVKLINNFGGELIIENCTVKSLLSQKLSQSLLGSTHEKLNLVENQLASAKIQWEQSQHNLISTQAQLQEAQTQWEKTQIQLVDERTQLEQTQVHLLSVKQQLDEAEKYLIYVKKEVERSHNLIQAMKTSKFWQLRTAWFKVRRALGLAGE
ncbi:methyltransferase [Tychonema sp. BBK16]|uniref:methyltransferase n=1 Tax=Tychonema sp. BBK16 TaxID=2699888 RepID=UPI001F2ADA30|nr:methyltransferase [Tychonema sp. BBK16]MCF6372239.1 methyltransferase [Tychonema sp. BBK16]